MDESSCALVSVRWSWWRNTLDRRFWTVSGAAVGAARMGFMPTMSTRAVVDDFGSLVAVR